ncbi:phosphotransferase enzyme family protein [Streptomyces noursei]|uniref:phosphotransferase enzyme family protein n=1 Tax=Streptomyces noursei TaxID=1971 RepID=UPI0019AE4C65|nr:aminoglycoside phosphotransferase family protein [Streptomyces noursei]MCZ1014841.1 aminoglycoside phosphotransferase family protein [Streptomyces noursei]GGX48127.1 aminoglycoside phosphotransferase [Streptomyces noursei]
MDAVVNHEGLTEASAARALASACRQVGLGSQSADLLRLGENAIYALASEGVAVRVARADTEDIKRKVAKELAVSRWLTSQGFPAARLFDELPQPVQVEGRLVTFWEYVPPSHVEPDLMDLAGLLRDLHALPRPDFPLPVLDPFPLMRRRLGLAQGVERQDVEFLTEACDRSETAFRSIMTEDAGGLIHGDAHRGNLLARDGQVLLIDYEAVAIGPRAWDLIPTAIAVDRFGLPPTVYTAFCRTYGQDVTEWHGYRVLRTVRELGMTTWLMQNAHSGPAAEEFALRMDSLRKDDRERRWHAL